MTSKKYTIKPMSQARGEIRSLKSSKPYPYYVAIDLPITGCPIPSHFDPRKSVAPEDCLKYYQNAYRRQDLYLIEALLFHAYTRKLADECNLSESFATDGLSTYLNDIKWLPNSSLSHGSIILDKDGIWSLVHNAHYVPPSAVQQVDVPNCETYIVLGDTRKYVDIMDDEDFMDAWLASLTQPNLVYDFEDFDFPANVDECLEHANFDKDTINDWLAALGNNDQDQLRTISMTLLHGNFQYSDKNCDLIINLACHSKNGRSLLLNKPPLHWTNFNEVAKELGDRIAFIPTNTGGYRHPPKAFRDGGMELTHQTLINSTHRNSLHAETVSKGILVFSDIEAIDRVMESVRGFTKLDITGWLLRSRSMSFTNKKITIREHVPEITTLAKKPKSTVEINTNARKTFFDKKDRRTFIEFNVPVFSIFTECDKAKITTVDEIMEYIENSYYNGLLAKFSDDLDALYQSLHHNDLGFSYGVMLTINASECYSIGNRAPIKTVAFEDKREDGSILCMFGGLNSSDTQRSNHQIKSKNYKARGIDGFLIPLSEYNVDQLKDLIKEHLLSEMRKVMEKSFGDNSILRWVKDKIHTLGMVNIVVTVGANSTEEEFNAIKRILKMKKITGIPSVDTVNTYPYIANSSMMDELLEIIAYL